MDHHRRGLRRLWNQQKIDEKQQQVWLEALAAAPELGPWDPADRAMLVYARKLTLAPASVDIQDVEQLRSHDFDDRAIHDICAVTAYFAFVNRIADGLGVELEAELEQ